MNLYEIINKLEINKGDKILVSSNIVRILINFKKENIKFNPNYIIDLLKEKIGKDGTLLFPTFNWDFCRGKTFNYHLTPSKTGTLSQAALKRNDFSRTLNPIYSFAVTGKNKKYICNLKHKNCFGLDSPFGYLIKNRGKHLFIDLKWRKSIGLNATGFIFHHVAEQMAKVEYRYYKEFKGFYINKNNIKKSFSTKFFVKDLNLKYSFYMNNELENFLIQKKLLRKKIFDDISFEVVNIPKAVKVLVNDLKKNRKFFVKTYF